MAWVRGQERLVYQRTFRQIRDKMLGPLGWDGTQLVGGALPFGATVAPTFIDLPPDPKWVPTALNTVAISEGTLPDDSDIELGLSLFETCHTIFVDIYGEDMSIAKAMASDVRSILVGRAPTCLRYVTLPDYTAAGTPDLPGHLIHFENVVVEYPAVPGQQYWAVVKAEAIHEWNP